MDSPPDHHPDRRQKLNKITFSGLPDRVSGSPPLAGLRQSEREAYECIQEFLEQEQVLEMDKLKFLSAVDTLSGAVHAQANGNMDDFFPKTVLAEKIMKLILEESTEALVSTVRQQAMLCVVALSQVNPPLHLSQKLDLATAGISSIISLPLIMPSLDRKESASLYLQTIQALDDMLQALVMEDLEPSMAFLQSFLEVVLPCLVQSDKVHEQTRILGAVSRILRFICNFPELAHMAEFSVTGKLMGTLGLLCMSPNLEVGMAASEALHYLFKVLTLQRSEKQKTENILKDLQKHFRGEWLASIQDLTMVARTPHPARAPGWEAQAGRGPGPRGDPHFEEGSPKSQVSWTACWRGRPVPLAALGWTEVSVTERDCAVRCGPLSSPDTCLWPSFPSGFSAEVDCWPWARCPRLRQLPPLPPETQTPPFTLPSSACPAQPHAHPLCLLNPLLVRLLRSGPAVTVTHLLPVTVAAPCSFPICRRPLRGTVFLPHSPRIVAQAQTASPHSPSDSCTSLFSHRGPVSHGRGGPWRRLGLTSASSCVQSFPLARGSLAGQTQEPLQAFAESVASSWKPSRIFSRHLLQKRPLVSQIWLDTPLGSCCHLPAAPLLPASLP